MELFIPPPEVARIGLRALKMVALADGRVHELESGLIESAQKHVLHTSFSLAELEPITPEELAATLPKELHERVLHACVICALIDGEASSLEVQLLHDYAAAFGIDDAAVKDVQRLVHAQLIRLRIDIGRRSFIGQRVKGFIAEGGARALIGIIESLLGLEDETLAARYRALADAEEGTLGRGYHDFIRRHGFSFPGEKGGAPEPIVFHDCLHVLAGYETTSIEETQIASFQAGMMKKDPVFGMLFMLAQFQLGVQITPVTEGEKLVVDPDLMLRAFVRGTHVNRDLTSGWRPEGDFHRPVDELRHEYNILPRD